MFGFEDRAKTKMHSDNRILVLKQIEGKKTLSTGGLVDQRLFKGGNSVHAIRNPFNSLWSIRYASGVLPDPLRQQFTSFNNLMKAASEYFGKRGLEIVDTIDHYEE